MSGLPFICTKRWLPTAIGVKVKLCTAPGVVFCGENDACQVAFDFKMTEFVGWGVASAGVMSNQMHTRCAHHM